MLEPTPSAIGESNEAVSGEGAAGQPMNEPALPWALSNSSTSARTAGRPAQASSRYADRSHGAAISTARPKTDITSESALFMT